MAAHFMRWHAMSKTTNFADVIPFQPKPDARDLVYRDWFDFLQLTLVRPVYPLGFMRRHQAD